MCRSPNGIFSAARQACADGDATRLRRCSRGCRLAAAPRSTAPSSCGFSSPRPLARWDSWMRAMSGPTRVGRVVVRSQERRGIRSAVSHAGRPPARRYRIPAQPRARSAHQWRARDAALAYAREHRSGVLMRAGVRRALRWTAYVSGALFGLVAIALVAGVFLLRTASFHDWVRREVVARVSPIMSGRHRDRLAFGIVLPRRHAP